MFLFRKILPEPYELINKLVLPKVEIGQVGKLIIAYEFVEYICIKDEIVKHRTESKVFPLSQFQNYEWSLLAFSAD